MESKNSNATDREVAEDSLNSLFSDDGDDIFSVDDDSEDYSQYDNLNKGSGDSEKEKPLTREDRERNVRDSNSPLRFFSEYYYSDPDIPREAKIDDGFGGKTVVPQVVDKWRCHYYYSARRKAKMATHLAMGILAVVLSIVAVANQVQGGILSLILFLILTINVFFRYWNLALYKLPMPAIPFLSSIDISALIKQRMDESEEKIREEEEKESREERDMEAFEQYKEKNHSTMYVDPVDDYSGDYPSPATILSDWMNSVAQMTRGDLVEASDGRINNFVATMLLKDNPEVWDDDDIVDSLAQVTSSHPSEWKKARDSWREAS